MIIPPTSDNVLSFADVISGLLLSGGKDLHPSYYREDECVSPGLIRPVPKERSDFEFALLDEVLKRDKPVLAICYGMQLLNVALGGSLYQDIGFQVPNALDHKKGDHAIKITRTDALDINDLKCSYTVNSHHHQAVKRLGDVGVFAVSDDGIVEGIFRKGYTFVIGVQWHPERGLSDGISEDIFRAFINKCAK